MERVNLFIDKYFEVFMSNDFYSLLVQIVLLRVNLDVATARVAVLYYTYLCGDALAHGVGVAYHAHLLALRRL